MSDVRCFLLSPTNRYDVRLRRFTVCADGCPKTTYGCSASTDIGVETCEGEVVQGDDPVRFPHDDPRWPLACAYCGAAFGASGQWVVDRERRYARSDGGPDCTLREPLPGAIWEAPWYAEFWHGDDGRCYEVMLPNGSRWVIDSKASNCTRPGDKAHHCWVRHGVAPDFHVDKNGDTCAAGAGSILAGSYHGFLHHGALVSC